MTNENALKLAINALRYIGCNVPLEEEAVEILEAMLALEKRRNEEIRKASKIKDLSFELPTFRHTQGDT